MGGDIHPDAIVVTRVHAESTGLVMRYTASDFDGGMLEGIIREPSGDGDVEHWVEGRDGSMYRRAYGAVSLGRTCVIPPVEDTQEALAGALTRFVTNTLPTAPERLF